jgi:hypothetical protein
MTMLPRSVARCSHVPAGFIDLKWYYDLELDGRLVYCVPLLIVLRKPFPGC